MSPYKDPAQRGQYARQYQRWARRKKRLAAQSHMDRRLRLYVCPVDKNFSVMTPAGRLTFYNGFILTENPDEVEAIEKHPLFGSRIIPLAIDWQYVRETITSSLGNLVEEVE